jgi:hypothetical protein
MKVRTALSTLLAATTLAASGFVTPMAQAATSTPMHSGDDCNPAGCHPPAGRGWRYINNYYWGSDCTESGNGGMDSGSWKQYQCTAGGSWHYYELWVK